MLRVAPPQATASEASPAKANEEKQSYVERLKRIVGDAFTYDKQESKKSKKKGIFEVLWRILTDKDITPEDFKTNFKNRFETFQNVLRDKGYLRNLSTRKQDFLRQIAILYRIAYALDLKNQQVQACDRYKASGQKSIFDKKAKLLSDLTQDEEKIEKFKKHLNTYKQSSENIIAEYKTAIECKESKNPLQVLLEKNLELLKNKLKRESEPTATQSTRIASINSTIEEMQKLRQSIYDFRNTLDNELEKAVNTLQTQHKTKLQVLYQNLSSEIGDKKTLLMCLTDIMTHQRDADDLFATTEAAASGFLSKDALDILKSTHSAVASLEEKKSAFEANMISQCDGFKILFQSIATIFAEGAVRWKNAKDFQDELFKELETIGDCDLTTGERLQKELRDTDSTIVSVDDSKNISTELSIKTLTVRAGELHDKLSDEITVAAQSLFSSKAKSAQPISEDPHVLSSSTHAIQPSEDDAKKNQQKREQQVIDFTNDITLNENEPPKLLKEFYDRLIEVNKEEDDTIKKAKSVAREAIEIQLTAFEKEVNAKIAMLKAAEQQQTTDASPKKAAPLPQAPAESKSDGYYKWCASSIFASLASTTSTAVVMLALTGIIATNPISLIVLTITSFICGAIAYAAYQKAQSELSKVGACLFAQPNKGPVSIVTPAPVTRCTVS